MAFRFGDPGGRAYNAVGTSQVNLLAWWTGASGTTSIFSVQSGGGRTTGSSLRAVFGGNSQYISKALDSQATWGVAFGLRLSAMPTGAQVPILFALGDAGTTQMELRVYPDGALRVTRSGTVIGTTAMFLVPNQYTHIEWLTTINSTTGTTQVWINGVSALSLINQNTRNTANNTANAVFLGHFSAAGGATTVTADYDDVIIYDGQTTDANGYSDIHDHIGDCGLTWLVPSGAGTTTQFTPGAGSNFAQVNEATPDGDTTYVEDATIGHIDTYACADLPATITGVKSAALIHYVRKTDVGSRGMKAELRSASANTAHATEQALGNSYQYYFSGWGSNPNNGSPIAWTPTTVNALEAGQTVSS